MAAPVEGEAERCWSCRERPPDSGAAVRVLFLKVPSLSRVPGRNVDISKRLAALQPESGTTPAAVDSILSCLAKECNLVQPFVYDTNFSAAWQQVKGDLVLVTDFEDKWARFEKNMQMLHYANEKQLLRAMVTL